MKFAYKAPSNTPSQNFQPKKGEPIVNEIKYNQAHEASRLFGRPFLYLQMTSREEDSTFKENIITEFTKAHTFYAFRDNDTVFDGSDGFGSFGGFGNIPNYNDLIHIPSKWFQDEDIIPMEGDLIKYPHSDKIFEIAKVDTQTIESLGTQTINDVNERPYVYRLFLSTWHYATNDEEFDITSDEEDINTLLSEIEEEKHNNKKDEKQTSVNKNDEWSKHKISVDNPFGDL